MRHDTEHTTGAGRRPEHRSDDGDGRPRDETGATDGGGPLMALDAGAGAALLLVGRVLFGGFLAFAGLNHFMNAGEMSQYAESKGVPMAGFGVIATGSMLVLGGLGILAGVYPVVSAGMVATFFVLVTPTMHDFWAVDEDQREAELTNFLKNTELFGASLVFLALGDQVWGFAVNVGLWL
jgi:uncharacterized membrane protein YphA (DoxX/SURF4 family)